MVKYCNMLVILVVLLAHSIKSLSIPDDCPVFNFRDWTGGAVPVDTWEKCTDTVDIWPIPEFCVASTCEFTNSGIYDSALANLQNSGWKSSCSVSSDGCSLPDFYDHPEYQAIFADACYIHDWCYSNSDQSKSDCDDDFKYNMLRICDMKWHEWETDAEHTFCQTISSLWHIAVVAGGSKHNEWSATAECFEISDHHYIAVGDPTQWSLADECTDNAATTDVTWISAYDNDIAVRCCDTDGTEGYSCDADGCTASGSTYCAYGKTWIEANDICVANGKRLCTLNELSLAQGSGCSHDARHVWVSDECVAHHWIAVGDPTQWSLADECTDNAATTGVTWISAYDNDIAVRCCDTDGSEGYSCSSAGCAASSSTYCADGKTWIEANDICVANGKRLCTLNELSLAQGSGCSHDARHVWVSDECVAPHWIAIGDPTLYSLADECTDNAATTGVTSVSSAYTDIAVRCCDTDGSEGYSCSSAGCAASSSTYCADGKTWIEANDICEGRGKRLCTLNELSLAATSGCSHDARHVWVSDECSLAGTSVPVFQPKGYNYKMIWLVIIILLVLNIVCLVGNMRKKTYQKYERVNFESETE